MNDLSPSTPLNYEAIATFSGRQCSRLHKDQSFNGAKLLLSNYRCLLYIARHTRISQVLENKACQKTCRTKTKKLLRSQEEPVKLIVPYGDALT